MTGLRRLLLFFIFLCTPLFCLSALDNKYDKYFTFKITPQFEIASGYINEFVFDDNCKNTDGKLSELNWNMRTIALFTLKADFDIIRYLNIGLSASAAVPQRTGFMQDSDWENSIIPEWMNDDPKEKTAFSEHINHLDKFINFRVSLGGNIYLPLEFKLTPRISYEYEFIRFTGSGGYYKYKSYNYTKKNFTGDVISYEQELNTLLLGLNLHAGCIPRTSIDINFDISPKMTFLNAIDYHYLKYDAYWDAFTNLLQIESGMTVQYCFTKNHSAGFSGRLQYIPVSKGDTSKTKITKNGDFVNEDWIPYGTGGTERYIWSLGLNYSFSL